MAQHKEGEKERQTETKSIANLCKRFLTISLGGSELLIVFQHLSANYKQNYGHLMKKETYRQRERERSEQSETSERERERERDQASELHSRRTHTHTHTHTHTLAQRQPHCANLEV